MVVFSLVGECRALVLVATVHPKKRNLTAVVVRLCHHFLTILNDDRLLLP